MNFHAILPMPLCPAGYPDEHFICYQFFMRATCFAHAILPSSKILTILIDMHCQVSHCIHCHILPLIPLPWVRSVLLTLHPQTLP